MPMKRKSFVTTLIAVFVLVALGACASQPSPAHDGLFGTPAATPMAPMPAAAPAMLELENAEWLMRGAVFEETDVYMNMIDTGGYTERRISTTANINMETYELEPAISAIRELVWESGGFIEQANFSAHGWGWHSSYNATLRIPGENYNSFLDNLREIGEITWLSETTQDHTAAFFDASIRLETRTIEEERIIELIERASYSGETSDLLRLEELLRNVRLEIDGLTRQIDHIDRLVAFHTIHLNLFEVEEHGVIAAATLTDRTGAAFAQSINDIVSLSRNFTVFFASIIAPAALFAAIVLLIRATRIRLKKT